MFGQHLELSFFDPIRFWGPDSGACAKCSHRHTRYVQRQRSGSAFTRTRLSIAGLYPITRRRFDYCSVVTADRTQEAQRESYLRFLSRKNHVVPAVHAACCWSDVYICEMCTQ